MVSFHLSGAQVLPLFQAVKVQQQCLLARLALQAQVMDWKHQSAAFLPFLELQQEEGAKLSSQATRLAGQCGNASTGFVFLLSCVQDLFRREHTPLK